MDGNRLKKEVLTKKPWWEVLPQGYMAHGTGAIRSDTKGINMPDDCLWRQVKTQADFLREYYPSAHPIFDESIYPDIYKKDPQSEKWYKQPIQRTAFAFQQVIATKHTLHLTGNDMQFEIVDGEESKAKVEEYQKQLVKFKKTWLMSGMEMNVYKAISAWNIVADAAIVGYLSGEKFGTKALSYLNGDTLYPHFDSITGELELFARKYYDYDEAGNESVEHVEVWDDTYLYRYSNEMQEKDEEGNVIKGKFSVGGYKLISKKPHGFPFIPISYAKRDDGPCWSAVQKNICDFEEAFSYLCENNKAFAFPIFYTKGDGEEIDLVGDMNGSVKYVGMTDKDAEAGFLNGTDASNAFATQLQKSYDLIYELSFTVKPPELKSGDLPGVAIKLLYSPALEAAMNDAQSLQSFIDKLVQIVKFGIGYEINETATFMKLPIIGYIKPYYHQNATEWVSNIAMAVQNGFISKRTASEKCPDLPVNDEYQRIIEEQKEKQQMDLLTQLEIQDNATDNAIEQEEASARINKGQKGQDVNTGHQGGGKRGRPARSGKVWDSNRNWAGRSNWDSLNKK